MGKTLIIFVLLTLLVGIQNCTTKPENSSIIVTEDPRGTNNPPFVAEGGGTTYDGKMTYYEYIPGFTCNGTPTFKSSVTVENGKAYFTFNKSTQCNFIENQEIPLEDVRSTKQSVVAFVEYGGSIYENLTTPVVDTSNTEYNEAYCQEIAPDVNDNLDVVVKYNSVTNIAKAKIYFFNGTEKQGTDWFVVTRQFSLSFFDYVYSDFKLVIDRNKPTNGFTGEFIDADLQVFKNGKLIIRKMKCATNPESMFG